MAAMNKTDFVKRLMVWAAPASWLWLLLLCGAWALSAPVASAQVDFAFSVGDGVDAYYLPMASRFVYAYDGYYYDWAGNGWLYSTDYVGPWYPLPPYSVLPLPLEYGPPPPMYPYQPYFIWWRAMVAPWYQVNHPAWWIRHHMDLDHYRIWRARVIPRYRGRPYYRGPMHPVFRPEYRGLPPAGRPYVRGRVIHPGGRPMIRPGYRPLPGPAPFVGRPQVRRYAGLPIRPLVRPTYRGQVRPPAFSQVRPMHPAPRQPMRRFGGTGGRPPMGRPIMRTFSGPGPGGK